MSDNWPKVIRDPVHNLIAFDNSPCDRLLLDLVNAPEVQRLRRVKQMGMTELVFPGANHSRFAHSLGVLHTARLFLDQLERASGRPFPTEHRAFILAAALLHDVGHGPFSHAFEQVTGQNHETYTRLIIHSDQTEVHRRLRAFDPAMPERLGRFFDEDADEVERAGGVPAYLARIVSGQLDADRCDYLLRDSHATGTNYGDYDLAWLLAQLRPDAANKRFYLTRKGLSAAETYLFARYHMYRTVYFHKASRAAEVMLKLFLRRYKETSGTHGDGRDAIGVIGDLFSGQMSLTRYLELDDHSITQMLKAAVRSPDATLASLADGLLNRRLYKALDVTAFASAHGLARLVELNERVQRRLGQLRLDPDYTFVEDTASDTPYEPYSPDAERPARQIYVESNDGRVVEISAVSEALLQLRKPYTMIRYYFPATFRDEIARIAQSALRGR